MSVARSNIARQFALTILFGPFLISLGCQGDTIISPYSGRDVHFSVFGFISSTDTHYVRVIPIRANGSRDLSPVDLDVVVSTRELTSNRVEIWEPVLPLRSDGSRGLQFADSSFGHVFRSTFTPNAGEEFQLEVMAFDGRLTSATATIPVVQPPIGRDFEVENGEVFQSILWPGVTQQPFRVLSLYFVTSTDLGPSTFAIPLYHNSTGTVTKDGLDLNINLNRDVREIRRHIVDNLSQFTSTPVLENPLTFNLNFLDRRVRLFVGDSTWNFISPDTDRTLVAQPGAVSNVENGLGFFGGVGTNLGTFPIQDLVVRQQIGFNS